MLALIVVVFGAILYINIKEMGGYDFAFQAAKPAGSSGTEQISTRAPTRINVGASNAVAGPGLDGDAQDAKEALETAWTLRLCDEAGTHAGTPEPPPAELVLLVHGLDDPGWTWSDMIDALVREGFVVARFDYPNDQAIAKSADHLAEALAKLKSSGVRSVSIIAHSMGGLVVRDALTRPGHYNSDGAGTATLPAVRRLIMIGTPNSGSQLARLRGVSEIGEHLSRTWAGERDLFAFLEDGEGQAGFDLIPASDFLTDLNKRPLAKNVKYTIIAGRVSPLEEGDVGAWVDRVDAVIPRDDLPKWVRDRLDNLDRDKVKESLAKLVGGVGDGAVPLDSAVLPEVTDVEIVEADHMTMIIDVLNVGIKPPAIPIVIDRLKRDGASEAKGGE